MKNIIILSAVVLGLMSCTGPQQARLIAATEAAALAALEAKAAGASGNAAKTSGIIAGLAAYKSPPAVETVPASALPVSETASK